VKRDGWNHEETIHAQIVLVAASILTLSAAALPKMSVAQSATVNGQVTKIDESAGKITLKHGPIKKLYACNHDCERPHKQRTKNDSCD
jgi:Cu/Ag efflux protein CusF